MAYDGTTPQGEEPNEFEQALADTSTEELKAIQSQSVNPDAKKRAKAQYHVPEGNALPVSREIVHQLYLAGVSSADLAAQFHVKKATVEKWVSRYKWHDEKNDQMARVEARAIEIESAKQDIVTNHLSGLAVECAKRIDGLKQLRTDSLMAYRTHAQALSTYDQIFRRTMGLGEGGNAQPRTLRLEIGRAPLPSQAPAPCVMEADATVVKSDT